MSDKKDLDVEGIILSPQIQEQMEKDPALAAAMRSMLADMRQAQHAVSTGQHRSFDDAMEAITGQRPVPVTPIASEEEES